MSLEDTADVLKNSNNGLHELNLKEKLMFKICEENGISYDDLIKVPLGKDLKRKYHDDITVLVLDLEK